MFENPPAWTVLTIVASCGAAWGGAKYALKSHESRIERLEVKVSKAVMAESCRNERVDCRSDRDSTLCELNRKIDRVFTAIEDQERKREIGKDAYQAIFRDLAVQIAELKTILNERKFVDDRNHITV